MAISRTAQDRQTNIKLEAAYNNTKQLIGKLSRTAFANILDKQKQNISTRIGYKGMLLIDEAELLLKHLAAEGHTNNDFYNELSQIVNPVRSKNELNEIKFSDEQNTDFTKLKVRGDVSLSCGYGAFVDSENVTGTCMVPTMTLRQYGASPARTEVVYAQGDSMSPEINSGDALLVDTSQIEIIDGVVYAFNYDGQAMCKRLQKIGNKIKAISRNPLYDPFEIDFTLQFNLIGRVVGFMRPII